MISQKAFGLPEIQIAIRTARYVLPEPFTSTTLLVSASILLDCKKSEPFSGGMPQFWLHVVRVGLRFLESGCGRANRSFNLSDCTLNHQNC